VVKEGKRKSGDCGRGRVLIGSITHYATFLPLLAPWGGDWFDLVYSIGSASFHTLDRQCSYNQSINQSVKLI